MVPLIADRNLDPRDDPGVPVIGDDSVSGLRQLQLVALGSTSQPERSDRDFLFAAARGFGYLGIDGRVRVR